MQEFIVAYDISDKKRLAKVARLLGKVGVRIEYSLFFVRVKKQEMIEIAFDIAEIIDTKKDDVRIYEIEDYGIALGDAQLLDEIYIIR
ncbi:MAG: CRISPR-associated endonuclease Cas2 [Nautiliaceae bacterium]